MSRRRRAALCGFVIVADLAMLHGVQALVGHAAFAVVGPLVAAAVTAVFWWLALRRRVRASTAMKIACGLLVLLVLPEWLEGEFAAGHEVDISAMLGHALLPAATVMVPLCIIGALEARRTIGLLRDAFGY